MDSKLTYLHEHKVSYTYKIKLLIKTTLSMKLWK